MNSLRHRTRERLPGQSVIDEAKYKIEKTAAYMEAHFDEAITREQLAAIADVNQEHFSRIFRKYKGVSPTEYLTAIRMEKAKELLLHSGLSIMKVARLVGYGDPYHFSRRFKQSVGVAPAFYMECAGIRVAALDCYGHCRTLGIEPVAADSSAIGAYANNLSERTVDLYDGSERPVNADRLNELKPDVIITMSANKEREKELASIAAVLKVNVLDDPVYSQLMRVAEALGKVREAAEWIGRYEARRTALRHQLAGKIGTDRVAVLRVREQFLQIYGMQNMGYPLYDALQLTPPEKIGLQSMCNIHFHSSAISAEELSFYEAEHLFVVLQPDSGARQEWERLFSSRAYQDYPAVRRGNVYQLDVSRWLAYDPISIVCQMEEAAALLTGRQGHHNYPSPAQFPSME